MQNGGGPSRPLRIGDTDTVAPGEVKHLSLKVFESSTGRPMNTPVFVVNSNEPGPVLFIIAGVHGNELNGVEIVREVIDSVDTSKVKGGLICIPAVNVPGFLNGSRTLPNGEDLNRLFPGCKDGSPGERLADTIMQILSQCDFGIAMHTAVDNWNNMPHIKADVSLTETKRLARAFGTEIIINEPGVEGMLRRTMTDMGKPCVILEAGEPNKFQRNVIDIGVRGVRNIMAALGIYPGEQRDPVFRVIVKRTEMLRSNRGGILNLKVGPRTLVYEGDPLFTVTNPFGKETDTQAAPFTGMVVGVRTRPIVSPGTSVIHLVKLDKTLSKVEDKLLESMRTLEERVAIGPTVPPDKVVEVEVGQREGEGEEGPAELEDVSEDTGDESDKEGGMPDGSE